MPLEPGAEPGGWVLGGRRGSYFRDAEDARRVRGLLLDGFAFRLAPDPLEAEAPPAAEGYEAPVRRWGRRPLESEKVRMEQNGAL